MEKQQKIQQNMIKCFTEEHKEIDAISYCPECRINMCNKCENIHSSFFKNHHAYKLNKDALDMAVTVNSFKAEKNGTHRVYSPVSESSGSSGGHSGGGHSGGGFSGGGGGHRF